MKKVTRKCGLCKEEIYVCDEKEEDYFCITKQYKKKSGLNGIKKEYYHSKCYIEYHSKTKKNGRITEEECIEQILKHKEESEKNNRYEFTKDQFTYFLEDMYSVNDIPKNFFLTLQSVYDGEYRNIKQAIPMVDLFDMWERKKNYLIKTREKQRQRGNNIDKMGAMYYDLTILVGQYDDYLEWKNKKIAEMGNKDVIDTSTMTHTFNPVTNMKPHVKQAVKKKEDSVDILSILDDI